MRAAHYRVICEQAFATWREVADFHRLRNSNER